MSKIIIGIDPDLEKSGVAVLGQSHFELKNLNFAEVVELFKAEQDLIKKVVIEAGWLNKKQILEAVLTNPLLLMSRFQDVWVKSMLQASCLFRWLNIWVWQLSK
ncbi:hypothetical protein P667_3629 [Acinetobacter baumannii UH5107]|nr:hypothetical protein P667_3629 [Acinetobacter baumannii UH5107]